MPLTCRRGQSGHWREKEGLWDSDHSLYSEKLHFDLLSFTLNCCVNFYLQENHVSIMQEITALNSGNVVQWSHFCPAGEQLREILEGTLRFPTFRAVHNLLFAYNLSLPPLVTGCTNYYHRAICLLEPSAEDARKDCTCSGSFQWPRTVWVFPIAGMWDIRRKNKAWLLQWNSYPWIRVRVVDTGWYKISWDVLNACNRNQNLNNKELYKYLTKNHN